jgi:hypothetical protein
VPAATATTATATATAAAAAAFARRAAHTGTAVRCLRGGNWPALLSESLEGLLVLSLVLLVALHVLLTGTGSVQAVWLATAPTLNSLLLLRRRAPGLL